MTKIVTKTYRIGWIKDGDKLSPAERKAAQDWQERQLDHSFRQTEAAFKAQKAASR